jgi:hypothetical protein
MYNQQSEPHNQYDQPQYGQQQYEQSSPYQQYEQSPSYQQEQQYEQQIPGQPVYGQPVQPIYGQPIYGQPVQPVYGQSVYGQPVQPIYVQPVYVQQVPLYAQPQVNIQVGMGVMEPQRSWLATLLLCIFLGPLGVHRFYSGHIGIGLFQFFTGGGFGLWWLIDLILILTNNYTDHYGRPLRK